MIDEYLQSVIRWSVDQEVDLPLVLNMAGLLVTGTLANEEEYVEGLAMLFDKAAREGGKEQVPDDMAQRISNILAGSHEVTLEPAMYVHLKDAKILAQGTGGPANVGWWRGSLESVDGFTIGALDI